MAALKCFGEIVQEYSIDRFQEISELLFPIIAPVSTLFKYLLKSIYSLKYQSIIKRIKNDNKENDQLQDNLLMLKRILATKINESYWNKLGEIVFQLIASGLFCGGAPRGGLMAGALVSGSSVRGSNPEARLSKAPETFQARKAIIS